MVLGAISVIFYMIPTARKLQCGSINLDDMVCFETNAVCVSSVADKQMASVLLSLYNDKRVRRIYLGAVLLYTGIL